MKKLLGFAMAVGALFTIMSCEEEAENPGNFNLKAELTLDSIMTSTLGHSYVLEEEAVFDTAYTDTYEKRDTTFETDAEGNFVLDGNGKKIPVIGGDGKYIIKIDTITFRTGKRGVYHKMKMITLESPADTFTIHLQSNAKWRAPEPVAPEGKVQWFFNYNLRTGGNSLTGNGDGHFYFRTLRNKNYARKTPVSQEIFTSDSTVMYQLNFGQAGERD